jgi:hypothetical protein
MFQILIQSFVRAEVTVGIILTLLLISGRSDPQTLAFSLGGVGVFLLLQGFVPLSRRAPGRTQATVKAEKSKLQDSDSAQANPEDPKVAKSKEDQPTIDRSTTISPCACAQRPFNRREYFIRAAIASLVMIGTACLIYWFAPPII